MKSRPTITIRRSDVPRWLPTVSGEVFLDDRQFAWLIGGRPKMITLRPGRRWLRVRLAVNGRRLDVGRAIEVEEGWNYDFECGHAAEEGGRGRPRVPPLFLVLLATIGLSLAPPMIWTARPVLALESLIAIPTDRVALTFVALVFCGLWGYLVVALICRPLRPLRTNAAYLEPGPLPPKKAGLEPAALLNGPATLWDPIHD